MRKIKEEQEIILENKRKIKNKMKNEENLFAKNSEKWFWKCWRTSEEEKSSKKT